MHISLLKRKKLKLNWNFNQIYFERSKIMEYNAFCNLFFSAETLLRIKIVLQPLPNICYMAPVIIGQ